MPQPQQSGPCFGPAPATIHGPTANMNAWVAASPAQRTWWWDVAGDILWRLAGKRHGNCSLTVRPCRRPRMDRRWFGGEWPIGGLWMIPYINDLGLWVNACCSMCGDECSCSPLREVFLPAPVTGITSVNVDGGILAPTAYTVYDRRRLVRTDGGRWPDCQDMTLADAAAGAFAITFTQGVPLGPAGQNALELFASELLLASTGSTCRLPSRVTQLTREGVQMTILDPLNFIEAGRVGLPEVDMWLAAVNPNSQRSASRVYSPDRPPVRTRTW